MTHNMAAPDAECVHQPDYVGCHALDRVAEAARIALAKAAMVEGDDLKPFGEDCYLILPKGCDATETRNAKDREPHTLPLVEERAVTDRDSGH